MSKYVWKPEGPKPKISAQVFGEVVEDLTDGDLGGAKPLDIVEAARKVTSPIHGLFEWDDDVAAERYRLDQARGWLRNLQIVRVDVKAGASTSERAFYSVKTPESRHYISRGRIKSDLDLRNELLRQALVELRRTFDRFGEVMAFGSFGPRLKEVIEEMEQQAEFVTNSALAPPRKPRGRGKATHAPTAHV